MRLSWKLFTSKILISTFSEHIRFFYKISWICHLLLKVLSIFEQVVSFIDRGRAEKNDFEILSISRFFISFSFFSLSFSFFYPSYAHIVDRMCRAAHQSSLLTLHVRHRSNPLFENIISSTYERTKLFHLRIRLKSKRTMAWSKRHVAACTLLVLGKNYASDSLPRIRNIYTREKHEFF